MWIIYTTNEITYIITIWLMIATFCSFYVISLELNNNRDPLNFQVTRQYSQLCNAIQFAFAIF